MPEDHFIVSKIKTIAGEKIILMEFSKGCLNSFSKYSGKNNADRIKLYSKINYLNENGVKGFLAGKKIYEISRLEKLEDIFSAIINMKALSAAGFASLLIKFIHCPVTAGALLIKGRGGKIRLFSSNNSFKKSRGPPAGYIQNILSETAGLFLNLAPARKPFTPFSFK